MSLRVAAILFGSVLMTLEAGFAQGWPVAGTPEEQQEGVPEPQPQAPQQSAPLLTPDQLDNLVGPVALYPDPLLSQVLAASTYPLEIVEAQQWLSQNRNLQGAEL